MAIGDFLQSGSYSRIEGVHWRKDGRILKAYITVYRDNTKSESISTIEFDLSSNEVNWPVISQIVNAEADVPLDADVILYENDEIYRATRSESEIRKKELSEGMKFILATDGKVYVVRDRVAVLENGFFLTTVEWDQKFGATALEAEGNCLFKAIYDQLKLRPEFQGTTDI